MAMVQVGTYKDSMGRSLPVHIDTDDLEQAEYHYYHKAKKLNRHALAMAILKGEVTAEDIESDSRFSFLTDKTNYIMQELANSKQ